MLSLVKILPINHYFNTTDSTCSFLAVFLYDCVNLCSRDGADSYFKDLIDVKIDVIHGSHRIPTTEKSPY